MISDKDRTPVAQNLMTICTRCKMELKHVVIFHNIQGIVEKVKCLTCGSEHKYHPDRKVKQEKTIKPGKKSSEPRKTRKPSEFDDLLKQFGHKESIPYSLSGAFKADDVIEHKTFGKGFVTSVSQQKMTVVFSDETRTLACKR